MSTPEEAAAKEYAEAGVELPELQEGAEETPETPEQPEAAPEAPEKDEPEEPEAHLQDEPKEQRKRSIYDDLKQKKQEVKSERELREQAEQERDELKEKLAALDTAATPEEKQEAKDDLEAFAKEINADPAALKRMRELFIKDVAPQSDPDLKARLDAFEAWQKDNAALIEAQQFEKEFAQVVPSLKQSFPDATDAEMDAIKKELDRISHTEGYHDKELDYVAYKNRETLAALVSPKKAGIERKGRADASESTPDFNPEADPTKMSPEELAIWYEQATKAGKPEGLVEDAQGRKLLI